MEIVFRIQYCYDPASHERLLENLSFCIPPIMLRQDEARHWLVSSTRRAHVEHAASSRRARGELTSSTDGAHYIVRAMRLPWEHRAQ